MKQKLIRTLLLLVLIFTASYRCLAVDMKTIGNGRSLDKMKLENEFTISMARRSAQLRDVSLPFCGSKRISTKWRKNVDFDIPCIPGLNEVMKTKKQFRRENAQAEQCRIVMACDERSAAGEICENFDTIDPFGDSSKANSVIHFISLLCRQRLEPLFEISRRWKWHNPLLINNVLNQLMRGTGEKTLDRSDLELLFAKKHPEESLSLGVQYDQIKGQKIEKQPLYLGSQNFVVYRAFKYVGKPIPCRSYCALGRLMSFKYNGPPVHLTLMLKPHCDWTVICTDTEIISSKSSVHCSRFNLVHLMLRNHFIQTGNSRYGVPFEFHRGYKTSQKDVTRVEFYIGTKIFVDNMFGQRHVANMQNVNVVALEFSHFDCVDPTFGVINSVDGFGYVLPGDPPNATAAITGQGGGGISSDSPTTPSSSSSTSTTSTTTTTTTTTPKTTTTTTTTSTTTIATTTPMTTTSTPSTEETGEIVVLKTTPGLKAAANLGDKRASKNYKLSGWSLWSTYYGFFTGSLLATLFLIICSYCCRHVFFRSWYDAMNLQAKGDVSGKQKRKKGAKSKRKDDSTASKSAPSPSEVDPSYPSKTSARGKNLATGLTATSGGADFSTGNNLTFI